MSAFRPVADEYNTVFGLVVAVRVSKENIHDVAAWCGGEVKEYANIDVPEPQLYISLTASNTHHKVVDDRADIGEWIVEVLEGGPRRFVYADKLFPKLLQNPGFKREEVTQLIKTAMTYQDMITSRGGEIEEGYSTAEFVALQIERLHR